MQESSTSSQTQSDLLLSCRYGMYGYFLVYHLARGAESLAQWPEVCFHHQI